MSLSIVELMKQPEHDLTWLQNALRSAKRQSAEACETVRQVLGYVMVEQELHGCSCAICRATNRSISPR
jgi:hypothetical protein